MSARRLALALFLLPAAAFAGDKVVCAPFAEKAPAIDGKLDDACWAGAAAMDDFVRPGTNFPADGKTRMAVVFDASGIYVGLTNILRAPIEIHAKAPEYCPAGKGYGFPYSVELFFDPGASGVPVNSYQILVNASGQYWGHRNMVWKGFNLPVESASTVEGDVWTMEVKVPFKGMRTGDVWGYNLCSNYVLPANVWSNTDGPYFNPRKFGQLLFGSSREWARSAGSRAAAELAAERRDNADPVCRRLLAAAEEKHQLMEAAGQRGEFLGFYSAYREFDNVFQRLKDLGGFRQAAAPGKLVKEVNFDNWQWRPLEKDLARRMKDFKRKGYPLPLEIRGPTYRAFEPSWGIPGTMVPEGGAVKGKAALFESGKEGFVVGEHSPFGMFLDPGKEYRYEVYLKGKGGFAFSAWLSGINAEGKSKPLGGAKLVGVAAAGDGWRKYEGTFKIPANTDKEYSSYNNPLMGGIMISADAKLYVDEFRIFEK